MGYLLDTNALSEVIRKRPSAALLQRLRETPADQLFTSVICVMELRAGAKRHPDGNALWQRIGKEVLARVVVLALGRREAEQAGDLLAILLERGAPIGVEDVLIAATAQANGL